MENVRNPEKQIRLDFTTVDLVEHFVSSPRVEMVADIVDTRLVVAIDKETNSFELLAHRVFAARKQVDGQIAAYLAKSGGAGQLGRSGEKRFIGRGLQGSETQWVVYERVDDRSITAQPVERCTRRREWRIQDVVLSRRR